MTLPFCKFHGFGNDYIVIEGEAIGSNIDLNDLAVQMCARYTGVGGDGIAVLRKLDGTAADYSCDIINPDGTAASFSGNGTRCAVAYLHYAGLWPDRRLRLETLSGIKIYDLTERRGSGEFWFEAEIGKPRFAPADIPFIDQTGLDIVVDRSLALHGERVTFSAVNVGNPVACIFVEDFALDWRSIGKEMETHELFPDRVNVVFIKVTDLENIDIRIWERGAGETSASGTCASAAAVMSAYLKKTGRRLSVHSEGGTTNILWRDDDEMVIRGRADLAFCGEWPSLA